MAGSMPDAHHQRAGIYPSRVLTQAETNYAQIEREVFVIIFAIKNFISTWKPFTLVTDHRPLYKILGQNQEVLTLAAARIQRWAVILSAYLYKIEYKPESQNQCTDCLSQLHAAITARASSEKMSMIQEMDVSTLPV